MMKINKLEIENVKRVKAVKVEPAANGLMTIGLLGIVFLAIFAEANFKTSTYLFIMSVGVAVTAASIFGGQMLLNEVEYREERKRK